MSSAIKVYGLVGKANEGEVNFSPHVWKTKIDLAILGVKYEDQGQSFHQINHELNKQVGKDVVTVPTIEVEGKFVTDSWVIAEYLEEKYGKEGKSLFGGSEAGKAFAKFIEIWANTTLASEFRPLLGPKVYERLDEPSAHHYIHKKLPKPSDLEVNIKKAQDPTFIKAQTASSRSRLQAIEDLLKYNRSSGKGGFLAGNIAGHADACLYGWYAFSRINEDVVHSVWEHDSLPEVKPWVEKVTKAFVSDGELI